MKVELLLLLLPPLHLIAAEVEHLIGRGVAHLAIIEELVGLEDTVPPLPQAQGAPLLVEKAMALWVLDGKCTETDVGGTA